MSMDRNFTPLAVCANKKKKKCRAWIVSLEAITESFVRCPASDEGSAHLWNWVWRNKVWLAAYRRKSGGGGEILPATFISAGSRTGREREKDEIWNSGPRNLCPIGDRLCRLFLNQIPLECLAAGSKMTRNSSFSRCRQEEKILLRALLSAWPLSKVRTEECRRAAKPCHNYSPARVFLFYNYFMIFSLESNARAPLILINYAARLKLTTSSFLFCVRKAKSWLHTRCSCNIFDPVATGLRKNSRVSFLSRDSRNILLFHAASSLKAKSIVIDSEHLQRLFLMK